MRPKHESNHYQRQSTKGHGSKPNCSSARAAWLACSVSEINRLDAKAAEMASYYPLEHSRVLLIGFRADDLCNINHALRIIGVDSVDWISNVHHLHKSCEYRLGFSHILVNIDAFHDVECAVDALLAYRSTSPDVVVVACSQMVSRDDFGCERTAICDATLKMPISTSRLAKGLVSTLKYNS